MRRGFLHAICVTTAGLFVHARLGAGCGSSGSSALTKVSGLEKTTLTVGSVPVADEAGLYIAQDQGLFAAEGLHVTIDSIVSSADATKGQNDGEYDVTAGNAVSYVQDQVTRQSNLEIVAEGSLMQPDNQALYTMPGSPVTTWAKKYPHTLAAFLDAVRAAQQIADTRRTAVEQAMEKLPVPYKVPPPIAAVMSLEAYPLSIAPDIDQARVQRVANEMFQFHMLSQPFQVNSMLGGL